jgi:hypothetical protein
MSSRKKILINNITEEIAAAILKELIIYSADTPKKILKKIRDLGDIKDPKNIIKLLPEKLHNKYNAILGAIKNHAEIGILKYDVSLSTM